MRRERGRKGLLRIDWHLVENKGRGEGKNVHIFEFLKGFNSNRSILRSLSPFTTINASEEKI